MVNEDIVKTFSNGSSCSKCRLEHSVNTGQMNVNPTLTTVLVGGEGRGEERRGGVSLKVADLK